MGQLVSDVTNVLNAQNSKRAANNKRQEILQQIAKDEQTKTNLIKKALATQRANYGAGGTNSASTSAGAVLQRLRNETAAPYDDKKEQNIKKIKNITVKKNNLLKNLLARLDNIVG